MIGAPHVVIGTRRRVSPEASIDGLAGLLGPLLAPEASSDLGIVMNGQVVLKRGRTPAQVANRRGRPLNAVIDGSPAGAPWTSPVSVRTGLLIAALPCRPPNPRDAVIAMIAAIFLLAGTTRCLQLDIFIAALPPLSIISC
jgi:hypothetical protein